MLRVPNDTPTGNRYPDGVAGQKVRTALYRFFDVGGGLLYVGITKDPKTRFSAHALTKRNTWWPLVASHTVDWFDDRPAAACAEIRAIRTEDPAYNQSCTPSPTLVSETGGQLISLADLEAFEWLTFGDTARRIVASGFYSSMSRPRLMYLAENDPEWPVPRAEWRYLAGAWLFPWQLIDAYLRGESCPSALPPAGSSTLPTVVTFTSGAELLVARGIAPRMTNEGVRAASRRNDWPFGEGRPHAYWRLGNIQAMATGPFLNYFSERTLDPRSPRPMPKQTFRGELLLRMAADRFGAEPFTQADLIALNEYGPAAVNRNVKVLASAGRLQQVGTRPTETGKGRPHALYVCTPEAQR